MRDHMPVINLSRGVISCEHSSRRQLRAEVFLKGQYYGLSLADRAQSDETGQEESGSPHEFDTTRQVL